MYARMCESYGECRNGCDLHEEGVLLKLSCRTFITEYPDKAKEIVEKWAKEHPIKTRQDVFLEQYPNAQLNMKGTLMIIPCYLDKNMATDKCSENRDCFTCSKEYWEEEV